MSHIRIRSVSMVLLVSTMITLSLPGDTAFAIGQVIAWGLNNRGQCDVPEPNADFIVVAGGENHSLGLNRDGTIIAWGYNNSGECNVPVPNADFIAVAGGASFSLGLKSNGTIVAWGYNEDGQCNVPAPNVGYIAVACGYFHSLGLESDGTIVAWGNNDEGQCNVPEPNEDFIAVAGGFKHSLGLKSDLTIVAWGRNGHGECNVPAPNADFIAVEGGGAHSIGLKSDGLIVAWGRNDYGQCNVPEPNADFIAVAGGASHGLGLKDVGTIVAWGWNNVGECDVPEPNGGFISVAAGLSHSFGLLGDPSFTLLVSDVPDDQGGEIEIFWDNQAYDAVSVFNPVNEYDVQRFDSEWQTLVTVPATQSEEYSVILPTEDIQILGQPVPYSQYRLIARTVAPLHLYTSLPDSGYSIDNLAPGAPELTLYDSETFRYLHWQSDDVFDMGETCLYRGNTPGFEASAPLYCSSDTEYWYIEDHLARYYYRACTFDIHRNASEWSNELVGNYPTAIPEAQINELRLYPNYPNPFNPATNISFNLPVRMRVSLCVHDVLGRVVRTLISGDAVHTGRHETIWDGRDGLGRPAPAGVYFYRLTAGGYSETKRMVLVK